MEKEKNKIAVSASIKAPVAKVWNLWTGKEHIKKWNTASDDWYTPEAENDLRPGGRFSYRMESRDGKMGFDFTGTYETVSPHETIRYTLEDGRKVWVRFSDTAGNTHVTEEFETENENPVDLQKAGWQAILDNFKKYAETL